MLMRCGVGKLVAADHEGGGDLFKGGVAGALADAVDGALDLAGTAFDAGEGVGDGHAEVVVAVGREDDGVDAGDGALDELEQGPRTRQAWCSRRCRGC